MKYNKKIDDETVQNCITDKKKMGLITSFTAKNYIEIACGGDEKKNKLTGYLMAGLVLVSKEENSETKYQFCPNEFDIITRRMNVVNSYLNYKTFVDRLKKADISLLNSNQRKDFNLKLQAHENMLKAYQEIKEYLFKN